MAIRRAALQVFFCSGMLLACEGRARKPPPENAVVAEGRRLYATYCATCHGVSANGYVADNAPSLRTTTFLASASETFWKEAIKRGRPGTAMAGYGRRLGGPLDDHQVDALVAFLRDGAPAPTALGPGRIAGDAKAGQAVYTAMCVRCHGTPAQRSTAVHLANPVFLETASDGFLRYAVAEGRAPTAMVAWSSVLSPRQIDDVVAYVRSLATPAGAPPAAAFGPTPAPVMPGPPAAPRKGPIVLNPRGRAPDFTLKDGLYVSIDQVKAALDQKRRLVIADARPPSDWMNLHIAGAISTPYYDGKSLDDIPNDGTWVLAYCACPHHVSGQVVDELRKRGYKHTAVIDEGIFAWAAKKYPIVAAPGFAPPPLPPPPPPAPPPARAPGPALRRHDGG